MLVIRTTAYTIRQSGGDCPSSHSFTSHETRPESIIGLTVSVEATRIGCLSEKVRVYRR